MTKIDILWRKPTVFEGDCLCFGHLFLFYKTGWGEPDIFRRFIFAVVWWAWGILWCGLGWQEIWDWKRGISLDHKSEFTTEAPKNRERRKISAKVGHGDARYEVNLAMHQAIPKSAPSIKKMATSSVTPLPITMLVLAPVATEKYHG
jgi:hypothetical protein